MPYWVFGSQIHVHVKGNEGVQALVDCLQGLQNTFPRFDHRFAFQHLGISSYDQILRIKALGGVASINPYYVYWRSNITAQYIGVERGYLAARYNTLFSTGVPVTMHADSPVGPPFPMLMAWTAVNRRNLQGKLVAPDEAVTVKQAMEMLTIWAAYSHKMDGLVGSIFPGQYADFTVLERDPYIVPKQLIKDIKVWGTVSGGKILRSADICANVDALLAGAVPPMM